MDNNISIVERLVEDRVEEETELTIAALYVKALFRQRDVIDSEGLEKEGVYVYVDDDPPEMVEKNC